MSKILVKIGHRWVSLSLVVRILCGLLAGTLLGLFFPRFTPVSILGVLFLGALKAIAPVLVAVLVMSSIAKAKGGLGARFRNVIFLYLFSTLLAAIAAVVVSFMCPVTITLNEAATADSNVQGLSEVFTTLMSNLVANPIESIAEGHYLGVLFWSIMIGIALKVTASEKTIVLVSDFASAISLVVKWVIQFAPFGILGLVFSTVSTSGLEIFSDYGKLLLVLVGTMFLVAFLLNPLIVCFYLRRNPYPLVWTCIRESGLNAFFTRSSAANIPINMDLCKRMGLTQDFYAVSIPLGSTVNMNGAAVTITVLTLAVCHTLGIEVSFLSAVILCIVSILGACGSSGVAGGSLLLVPMACSLFGIENNIAMEAVGVGFIISVVQDSVETALNSSGDALFTATAEFHDYLTENKPFKFGLK